MGDWCQAMVNAARDVFRWAFPQEIELPECVVRLLEALYPNIDWDTVTFYNGKPWFAKGGAIRGITLPDFYGVHEIKIYFRPDVYDPCDCAGLITLVHEAYHVQQYREILDGVGLGFLRGFMISYLAGAWRGGGMGHSMEVAPHDYDIRFESCCTGSPCDCSTDPPTLVQANIDNMLAACPDLVVTDTGISFWERMFDATPGARWLWDRATDLVRWACTLERDAVDVRVGTGGASGLSQSSWNAIGKWMLTCPAFGFLSLVIRLIAIVWAVVWGIIWTVITVVLAILLPIIDLILLIADALVWVAAGVVCAVEWLWDRFREAMASVCVWAENLEGECTQWREERERVCTEEEDQGYRECTEEEDQGYRECAREEDQGYRDCCDWAPCSWFCDAWVWVSNIVCVAWTWVENIVCVAWTWVSNIVCVAWTWVVSRTCAVFTWVVTGLTCWAR